MICSTHHVASLLLSGFLVFQIKKMMNNWFLKHCRSSYPHFILCKRATREQNGRIDLNTTPNARQIIEDKMGRPNLFPRKYIANDVNYFCALMLGPINKMDEQLVNLNMKVGLPHFILVQQDVSRCLKNCSKTYCERRQRRKHIWEQRLEMKWVDLTFFCKKCHGHCRSFLLFSF